MSPTSAKPPLSLGRIAGLALGVLLVGALGVFAGSWTRGLIGSRDAVPLVSDSILEVGMPFPTVTLRSPGGSPLSSHDALGSDGAVVVFLDLGCPPCEDMAGAWRDALVGEADVSVVGITNHAEDAITEFSEAHDIPFPIYQDVDRVFVHEFGVNRYPQEWVIDATGTIRSRRYETGEALDVTAVRRALEG